MQTSPRPFRTPPANLIPSLYRLGLGPLIGHFILLLTTTGRKTGLPRVTALQYEDLYGAIYVGSARGTRADWFRNIRANPCVEVRVGNRHFVGMAETVTDVSRIADFLELRQKRHPRMVGAIFKSEGLPGVPSRAELEAYASRLAMVIIRPV
jgi:deazaflavin-dependent oxidoreductase (nitroreductase family)